MKLNKHQQQIVDVMRAEGRPMNLHEISAALKLSGARSLIGGRLTRLYAMGVLERRPSFAMVGGLKGAMRKAKMHAYSLKENMT